MAYDPKDKADVAIMQGLVDAALLEQAEEHETATTGLKAKVADLLGKLKKANTGESDGAEVARLEGELEVAKGQLKETTKKLTTTEKALTTASESLTTESAVTKSLLVDNGLTAALTAANVAPQYMDAAKAMLGSQVTVKQDGDKRIAVVGDKALGDFVKEWSQGDQGKHFVVAASNSGGNSPGGKASGTNPKTMTRAEYDTANNAAPGSLTKFFSEGGTLTD